jgi:hypothetical protein
MSNQSTDASLLKKRISGALQYLKELDEKLDLDNLGSLDIKLDGLASSLLHSGLVDSARARKQVKAVPLADVIELFVEKQLLDSKASRAAQELSLLVEVLRYTSDEPTEQEREEGQRLVKDLVETIRPVLEQHANKS